MWQYRFARFVDGRRMAQGAAVYADTVAEAGEKARKLFEDDAQPGEMERTNFVLVDILESGQS